MKKFLIVSALISSLLISSVVPVLAALQPLPITQAPFIHPGLYQTDLFTGSASYSYPLKVPKGTNDLTPDVSLQYNSHSARDPLQSSGIGWQLSKDYVERDGNYTYSSYYLGDDKFRLHFKGAVYELVYVAGENRYHTKIESNLHIQKLTGGSNEKNEYWEVITPDGTKYRFGYQTNSEVICTGRNYVNTWQLDQVEDRHTNKIFYTYTESGGAAYLSKIEYNSEKSRVIDFTHTTNPYQRPVHIQGCSVTETKRLDSIQMKANTNLVRQFDLGYQTASNSSQLLQSITEKGNTSTASALPATTFAYKPTSKTWSQNPEYWISNAEIGVHLEEVNVQMADVDGDGLLDIVKSEGTGNNTWKVYKNTGSSWNTTAETWVNNQPIDARLEGSDVRLIDVTGDGLPDIVKMHNDSGNLTYKVYRNTGSAWNTSAEYWINSNSNVPNITVLGMGIADVNGDNLADLIGSYNHDLWNVYVNTGSSWSTTPQTWADGLDAKFGESNTALVDVNGDGYPEIVKTTHSGNNATWYVYKNSGAGWSTSADAWINNAPIEAYLGMDTVVLQDMDGDGLPDIVKTTADPVKWYVLLNKGNSWETTWREWADASAGGVPASLGANVQMADVTGDGMPEAIRTVNSGSNVTWQVWVNQSKSPYLLSKVTTSQGGTITFDYKASTVYDNTGFDSFSDLPFPLWLVSSMTQDNGMTNVHQATDTTTYSYKDGLYDWQDKEFRGFGEVTETLPNSAKRKYQFHQDDVLKGRIKSIQTTDSINIPYLKTESVWGIATSSGVMTIRLDEEKEHTHDGATASAKVRETEYQYDSYGNVTRIAELGDTSTADDDRFTYNAYTASASAWLVNTLKHTFKNASDDSTKVSETYLYYDQHSGNSDAPHFGDVTKKVEWLSGGSNPETNYTYDKYGNVRTITDPNNHTTTITYDDAEPSSSIPVSNTVSQTNSVGISGDAQWHLLDSMTITDNFATTSAQVDFTSYVTNNSANTTVFMYTRLDGVDKDLMTFVTGGGGGGSQTMSSSSTMTMSPGQHTIDVRVWTNSSTVSVGNRSLTTQHHATVSSAATPTYPTSITNAKNQTTTYNYDLGTGNLLSQTDPNGITTSYEYDEFGRITKEIKPGDTSTYPTTKYQYFWDGIAPEGMLVSKREVASSSATLDTYTIVDGLGRKIQTRSDAEDSTKQRIVDAYYDPTGQVKKETVPYLASSSALLTTPTPPPASKFGDGSDGNLTISSNTTESPIDSSVTATSGTTTATVGSGLGFVENQIVLFHQTQGTNAGLWEYARVDSYSGTTLTLTDTLTNSYSSSGSNKAQVRVVPQYHNVTVNNSVTWSSKAWNGTTGGILAFLADGTVTVTGTINAAGLNGTNWEYGASGGAGVGFRGGNGGQGSATASYGEGTAGISAVGTSANGNGGGAVGSLPQEVPQLQPVAAEDTQ